MYDQLRRKQADYLCVIKTDGRTPSHPRSPECRRALIYGVATAEIIAFVSFNYLLVCLGN